MSVNQIAGPSTPLARRGYAAVPKPVKATQESTTATPRARAPPRLDTEKHKRYGPGLGSADGQASGSGSRRVGSPHSFGLKPKMDSEPDSTVSRANPFSASGSRPSSKPRSFGLKPKIKSDQGSMVSRLDTTSPGKTLKDRTRPDLSIPWVSKESNGAGSPSERATRQSPNSDSESRSHAPYRKPPLYPAPTPPGDSTPTPSTVLDFANLPPHPCPRSQIHFVGLHHDTAITAFHRPSTSDVPIIKYRDTYIHLRAMPSRLLPKPPRPPFPARSTSIPGSASPLTSDSTSASDLASWEVPTKGTYTERHPSKQIIAFGVIATKNGVSGFAPERGRVRKKFKAAVEGVVNRSWGLGEAEGKDLVISDWSYLAVLHREVYDATIPELCESLLAGLRYITKQQQRVGNNFTSGSGPGTGSGFGAGAGPSSSSSSNPNRRSNSNSNTSRPAPRKRSC